MVAASNEFQDERKIRSLVFCQSQSQPSKTCWMPASLRQQLGPARMLKTWLYIPITAVRMLLAHLLKVPIELWDTWSQGFLGLICPMPAKHYSPRVGSRRWSCYVGPRGTGESCPQGQVWPALLSRGITLLLPSAWTLHGVCSWGWAGIHLASRSILSNTSLSSNCFWMSYRSQRRNGAVEGASRGSASIWGTIQHAGLPFLSGKHRGD